MNLIFEWDENKARMNVQKHKVAFDEARTLFNDPRLVTYLDESHSEVEERYISIGTSARDRVLLVVHTEQEETRDTFTIRLISCRRATASERQAYEEGNA
ncbi:MAG: BrnT family toxin [Planctomycetes bacterium]|nr:BrnT family toxin [Planctomycetota bacterium]